MNAYLLYAALMVLLLAATVAILPWPWELLAGVFALGIGDGVGRYRRSHR